MCHTYPIPTETPGDMAEKNAEKNADWEDFRRANHLRVDNGRNRSVRPFAQSDWWRGRELEGLKNDDSQ